MDIPGDPLFIRSGGASRNPMASFMDGPRAHALQLAHEAHSMIISKYLRGQREHGGELWRKTGIIDMAIEEAVDQVIYLLTLRDQIADAGVTLGDLSE